MADKLIIDCEKQTEELVQLTQAEQDALAADQAAAAVIAADVALQDTNAATLRDRIQQAITTLTNAHTNWGTLTAAQKDSALKLNVRVTVALARLHLRKLDATD